MKLRFYKVSALAFLLLLGVALHACGHGGTEVGNPPNPQSPTADAPVSETDGATPTPSPGAQLIFDAPQEDEIAQNPEEMEP